MIDRSSMGGEVRGFEWGLAVLLASGAMMGSSLGQSVPITMNGVPEQVIPRVMEVGLGSFVITPSVGIPSTSFPPGDAPAAGGGSFGGGGAGTSAGASVALDTMSSRSWGAAAGQGATMVGVNPSALAATCVIESGCQNFAAKDGTTIRGAFQMKDTTFEASMTKALQYNPGLSGTIDRGIAGSMDPANQAIAAAANLRVDAERLQAAGIANPTVLDVRGGFNFGARYTTTLALASNDQLMAPLMPSYSPEVLQKNGISPTTTMGDWRARVAAKMGDAAYQPVLIGT